MMQGITFRFATVDDIPMICQFRITQLARGGAVKVEGIDDELVRFYNECFEQDTIRQIFAYENEKAIATGAVLFYSYPPSHVNKSGKIAYISNMFTDPEYRNRGIASQILSMLEDEARNRGITTAKLGATAMGKSVYEHAGYKEDVLYTLIKEL